MSKNKTIENEDDINTFLRGVEDVQKREDAYRLIKIMKDVTGFEPKMWGNSIIGFGKYHYKYDSGREGDMFYSGFSPRKQNLTIYVMAGLERYQTLLKDIGKYKIGKSCFYIKKLEDINLDIMTEMIEDSVKVIQHKYG